MKSHTATKSEQRWMKDINDLGCCVCLKFLRVHTPPEIHHIKGKVKLGSHLQTIPLCYRHHREGSNNYQYTSRHPWKKSFEDLYGTEAELLEFTKEKIDERNRSR